MEQKKKHSHKGHRQRIKNKALEGGIEHWPPHEVLELILTYAIPFKDVNPLAHELIDAFGSLGGVLDAGYEQLKKIDGVGDETALFLSLLPDLFTRYTASKNVADIIMDAPYKCVNYFRTIDRVRDVEGFYVFCLNGKKKLIKTIKFNSDLPSEISVPLTSFAEKIIFKSNKSIVIMHSHPSGDAKPTSADLDATARLMSSISTLGVKLDDHIIITETEYFSFRNSGLLEDMEKGTFPLIYNKTTSKN